MDIVDFFLIGALIIVAVVAIPFILIPSINIIPAIIIIILASILVYRNTWVTFFKLVIILMSLALLLAAFFLIYTRDKDIYDIAQDIKERKAKISKGFESFKDKAAEISREITDFPK